MLIVKALVGAAVLLLGRQLYWLFVAAVGFLLGIAITTRVFGSQPDSVVAIAALVGGLLGAGLAILGQKLAIGIAGFVAGGYVVLTALDLLRIGGGGGTLTGFGLILCIAGGVIGALLVILLFDGTLIVLSSLTGATLLTQVTGQAFDLGRLPGVALFVLLLAVGIGVQWALWRRGTPTKATATTPHRSQNRS